MIHCDINLCVGCRMCEVSCGDFHYGAVSPVLSRIRVAKLESTGIELAVACLSCVEKPCLECPTEALSVGETGEILLKDDLCSGCDICVDACPVGAVGMYDGLPLFCDLCGGETICVSTCPTGALSNKNDDVSLEEFLESRGNANTRRAEYAKVLGKPLREKWINGGRIDS